MIHDIPERGKSSELGTKMTKEAEARVEVEGAFSVRLHPCAVQLDVRTAVADIVSDIGRYL